MKSREPLQPLLMFIAPDKSLILAMKKGRRVKVVCFGRKRHYRKDGSCKHVDEVLANMKPYWRSRADVDPFGGKQPSAPTDEA